jgi:hypothetical protein
MSGAGGISASGGVRIVDRREIAVAGARRPVLFAVLALPERTG